MFLIDQRIAMPHHRNALQCDNGHHTCATQRNKCTHAQRMYTKVVTLCNQLSGLSNGHRTANTLRTQTCGSIHPNRLYRYDTVVHQLSHCCNCTNQKKNHLVRFRMWTISSHVQTLVVHSTTCCCMTRTHTKTHEIRNPQSAVRKTDDLHSMPRQSAQRIRPVPRWFVPSHLWPAIIMWHYNRCSHTSSSACVRI